MTRHPLRAIHALLLFLALVAIAGAAMPVWAERRNGFELSGASIPIDEIRHGGPPRDGIPAIDRPRFVAASEAPFLQPQDRVLGFAHRGIARAYPIAILNWHEIVNDRYAHEPIAVTFCPLCGTGMVFGARVAGRDLDFGVSGLLYNSDVLLYDRQTESLWSQIMAEAVSGPLRGTRLEFLPTAHTTWADWRARHPNTEVLSPDTGHRRDYARDPYADYVGSEQTMFPVGARDNRLHPKEQVIGVSLNGEHKAYPFSALAGLGVSHFADVVGGQHIRVEFDARARTARVVDNHGKEVPALVAFWFAWYAFHPETQLFAP